MIVKESKYFIFDHPIDNNLRNIIRRFVWPIKNFSKKIYLISNKPSIEEKKYNVSVCAIFKNEAPYLKEWIEFNHIVGVDHFYMYNNNSEDSYEKILEPYVEKGLVTLVQWPHNQKQMESYMDCIDRFSSETKWMGFIDIDEYIVPKSTDNIYDFLKKYENKGSVNIYWRLFGSSGLMDRDLDRLVVEDFTVCWPKYCDIGKCFYNTSFEFDTNSDHSKCLHHWLWTKIGDKEIPPVNVFDHFCIDYCNIADKEDFPIQINHYFTKSYKEYAMKRAKGDVYFKINPHDEEYFYEHEMKCTSTDYSAYKFLVKLKLKMGKNE